jgi:tripartite-type tricarboxylate transporter receptor subunit TctC
MTKALLSLLLALGATSHAAAQAYPTKPIKVVVGFAAGGPADVLARIIGQRMTTLLGQSLVIENRPGAGGTIGARSVATAEPDGHTLLFGNTSTLVIGPLMNRNLDYDTLKSFAPIASVGTSSNLLVVNPGFPVTSVQELVAYAKANPGKLNYSSPGIGTPPHLIGETLKQRAGIEITHVPYRGGGQAAGDVVSRQVQMAFENPAVALPLVQAGRIRALAVTSETRNPQAPDIPTMIESGFPGFVSVSFTGMVAPAGTPASIIGRLNTVVNESLALPDVQATLMKLAVEARPASPEAFAAFLARERDKWGAMITAVGIAAK